MNRRFLSVDEIARKHRDINRAVLYGVPPGNWFQRWVDDVETLLAVLATERQAAHNDCLALQHENTEVCTDLMFANAERRKAGEALLRYGRHDPTCPAGRILAVGVPLPGPCDCGLAVKQEGAGP